MDPRIARPTIAAAVVLALIVPIVIAAGLLVRGYTRAAFQNEQDATAMRAVAFNALRYQLDEETGVRGYAATRDRTYLEPYDTGRALLPATLRRLREDARRLQLDAAAARIDDARRTSERWNATVARPLLAHRAGAPALQLRGKALMDAYRDDMEVVQEAIDARKRQLDAATEAAIDRLNLFVALVASAVVGLGIVFGVQQFRLAAVLAAKQREAAELTAAYQTEKRLAERLQDAFVQRPLPVLPAVSFSATYVPATEESKVGGDWYDGVELARERVMFVIGDVAGHGLEAAVAMNRARQALVSAAVVDPDPAQLLARVNAELLDQRARMVTAVCGYADARTFEFVYATAGHPPPVLVEPGRPPRMLECGGLPLAVVEEAQYRSHTVQTVPGAMLVLYTDGAVEHSRDVIAGEQTLLAAVSAAIDGNTPNPAAAIHSAIFDSRSVGDDVAIMTVSFMPGAGASGEPAGTATIVAAGARGTPEGVRGTVVSLAARLRRAARPGRRDGVRIAS